MTVTYVCSVVYEKTTLAENAHFEVDLKPSGDRRSVIINSDLLYLMVKRIDFHGMVRHSHLYEGLSSSTQLL